MKHLTNTEIEQIVLAEIIENSNLFYKYFNQINISLFSAEENRRIFEIIDFLQHDNKPIDLRIIQAEISVRRLNLNDYLTQIIDNRSFSNNFEHYLMILVELSAKRDFIFTFSNLIKSINTSKENIYTIRDIAIEEFNKLFIDRFSEINKGDEPFKNLIDKEEERFSKIQEGTIPGLPSSLNIINKAFGGWQKSDLIVVAGRPGMGKSAFMVQQTIDIATQGMSVGLFSLEMSSGQITSRIITNYTQIPNSSILRKGLNYEELTRYYELKENMSALNIHIDDTPNLSIENLRVKAKMMKLRYDIDIIMVDYLQLITFGKAQNREQEVSKISRNLKGIAKELDIPVIALAQLSRNVEQRGDKRPLLSDLRDSGAIEQDADGVMFLYRPEYYGIETWDEAYNFEDTNNQAEIIIAKNRNGGILSERSKINLATSTFRNLL